MQIQFTLALQSVYEWISIDARARQSYKSRRKAVATHLATQVGDYVSLRRTSKYERGHDRVWLRARCPGPDRRIHCGVRSVVAWAAVQKP